MAAMPMHKAMTIMIRERWDVRKGRTNRAIKPWGSTDGKDCMIPAPA